MGSLRGIAFWLFLCSLEQYWWNRSAPQGVEAQTTKPIEQIPHGAARNYPFCITDETLIEYKGDLEKGPTILGKHLKDIKDHPGKRAYRHTSKRQSKSPQGPVQGIASTKYYRIVTNMPSGLEWHMYRYLRQWIHIHVTAKNDLQGLVVQINVLPYGMAYGNVDLEFGCKDCKDNGGTDINLEAATTEGALELGGRAAAIPCRRRAYIHVRHPTVYVYASETKKKDFHINYNFLDVKCRQTEVLQLVFLTATSSSSMKLAKTSAINHSYEGFGVDSPDGMPYPFHVDFRSQFSCHKENETMNFISGPSASYRQTLNAYSGVYDSCIRASSGDFDTYWKDHSFFISNKVCAYPKRTLCDYGNKGNWPGDGPAPKPEDGSPAPPFDICTDCSVDENDFTRKVLSRLIRRSYMQRRAHGIAMVFGLVLLGVISIHLARYWKETGGGCLLVGWWLWAHLGLLYAAKCAMYIGLGLAMCQAPRAESENESEMELFDLEDNREKLIFLHKIVGTIPVVAFHTECILGPWRPSSASLRLISILVHVVFGYVSVFFAFVAVVISTACKEVKLLTMAIIAVSFIFWVIAMILQILSDMSSKMSPGRSYFPVIEAVKVSKSSSIVRKIVFGLMTFIVVVLLLLLTAKSSYQGLIFSEPCDNCKWKWDEQMVFNKTDTDAVNQPVHAFYKCKKDGDNDPRWNSVVGF